MIYFETSFAKLIWDDKTNCIILTYAGFGEGEALREPLNKGLELIKLKKSNKWLSDLYNIRVINIEDQNWTSDHWTKAAFALGLKYLAIVVPTNILGQMSLQRGVDRANFNELGLETALFDNLESAKAWLNSK